MKAFVACLIILCLLVASFFLVHHYITTSFDEYFRLLDDVDAALTDCDFSRLEALSETISKKLSDQSFWLYMLTDRTPLDNANTAAAQLSQYIAHRDTPEIAAMSAQLRLMLHHIVEKSLLSIENIL